MRTGHRPRAFTIIELLVVVSIIALLVGILLPAIGKARDQAKVSISQANLRNIGTAHGSYAAEWNDRQLTFVNDGISTYGAHFNVAFSNYWAEHSGYGESTQHPGVILGWGVYHRNGGYYYLMYRTGSNCANASLTLPVVWTGGGCNDGLAYFGAFRLMNAEQFHQYVSGRFYDQIFYAPKDKHVYEASSPCFESPDQFCDMANINRTLGDIPAWSSYVLSPAAMFNPSVLRHSDPDDDAYNGYMSPWTQPAGFRSPTFSQARFPALKTHVLEHHWLQNNSVADCNPGFDPGTYGNPGCEPYYFNHAWESSPISLFYDGHVEGIGTRNTMRADGRMRVQTGVPEWGLWSKDTPWGTDGYLIEYGYDQAATSFHVLTTDGILGRDITAD